MSVSGTLILPNQPTSGSVTIKPLGGQGYHSPQSFYLVEMNISSDASGGTNQILVNMDPQFQGVVSLIMASLASPAADRVVRLDIFLDGLTLPLSVQATMDFDGDVGQHLLYSPPPVFNTLRIGGLVDNVDTETFTLRMIVYNFKRDAFQKVPLNILLDALPRGFAIQ